MWIEVDKETANAAYNNNKSVRIGDDAEFNSWLVSKEFDEKSLELAVSRYLNYYHNPVKYFINSEQFENGWWCQSDDELRRKICQINGFDCDYFDKAYARFLTK